jgi:hypothetical protein
MLKPILLRFQGGCWDGRSLRTDSRDQEESLLAWACYEMCHHGAIGAECGGLSDDAVCFARVHGWPQDPAGRLPDFRGYAVSERRENEHEIAITLTCLPAESP